MVPLRESLLVAILAASPPMLEAVVLRRACTPRMRIPSGLFALTVYELKAVCRAKGLKVYRLFQKATHTRIS